MMPLNPPIWRFRCPLCLKRLVGPEQLVVFKPASANVSDERDSSKMIDCGPDFMHEVRDFVGHLGDHISGGVFVSHVKCEAKHPWLATRLIPSEDGKPPSPVKEISIPGSEEDGETCPVQFLCSVTATPIKKKIKHWTIRMLRETSKHSKTNEAMWFPYLLLAATAAADEMDSERPCGNLVELAGTKSVGKTILTMQLMHEELFGRLADGRRIKSFQYFFPRGTSGVSFPKELYTFSAWKHQPTFRPLSTEPTPGDLRAVFIERVSQSGAAASRIQFASPDSDGGWLRRVLRSLRTVVQQASENMKEEDPDLPSTAEPFVPTPSPQWVPILFYDSAGESQERESDTIRRLHNLTNKLAICIDAEELIDPRKEKTSIKHACSRLDDLTQQRYRRRSTCIVLTKTDLIENHLTRQERLSLYSTGGPNTARELLSRLLKKGATDDLGSLLAYLSREDEHERIIDDVFFVSTRRLPFMQGIRLSPVESFSPLSAAPGEQLIVKAANGYKFKTATGAVTEDETGADAVLRVKKVMIHGQPADFKIENRETIEVIVPQDARGFIEILSERWDKEEDKFVEDKANSEPFFNVLDVVTRESLKPISLGLIPFLAWCGDISESDIVRGSRIMVGQDRKPGKKNTEPSVGVT